MSNALNRSETLIGQAEVLSRLEQILHEGRAQSILFLGPRGSGRHSLARAAAKALLCEGPHSGLNPLQSMEKIQPLLSESKEHWLLFLDFLQSDLRDLALLLAESGKKASFHLMNEDKRGELRAFLQKIPQDSLARRLDAAMQGLISLRRAEAAHVNFELSSWQLQLLLSECFEAKGE